MQPMKGNKEPSVAKREAAPVRRANALFAPMIPAGGDVRAWSPAVDIRLCNGDLVITAELPGLKKDEVTIEVTGDALVMQGERKREHQEDHEGFHSWGRSYGQFYSSVALPKGAKTDQVKAELQDGILKVSVPVPHAGKKARQVPIEAKTATAKAGTSAIPVWPSGLRSSSSLAKKNSLSFLMGPPKLPPN